MNHRRKTRGFALMAALWLLIALSTLGLELSVVARHRRLVVANTLESMRAERAAWSGVEHVRARLAPFGGSAGHGTTDELSVVDPLRRADAIAPDTVTMDDGAAYGVTSTDIGVLVNINLVDEAGLTRFLIASTVDPLTADALAQAIMDWRDADDFRRLRGAERDDYIKAGARELPRNEPFESVDELRFVRGMTHSILQRVAPSLTVFGGGEINVNKATEAVLLTVPGMTALAATVITSAQLRHRRIADLRQLMDLLPLPARTALEQAPLGVARLTFDTHELEVRSIGWVKGSPIRVRETAIVTRIGATPVVTWRRTE